MIKRRGAVIMEKNDDDRIMDLECLNCGEGPMRLTGRKQYGLVVYQD